MSIWTVKPETVKIDLVYALDGVDNPFHITIKKRLNVGEQRKVQTAGLRGFRQQAARGGDEAASEISVDWRQQSFARTEAYLTDWSLSEDDGKKIKVSRESIESLPSAVFDIIEEAINKHVDGVGAEKKIPSGDGEQPATSS